MKIKKIITIFTVILLILIISLASFVGVYKKNEYKVSNVLPDYILGMEFGDSRVISLEIDKSVENIIYDKDGNEVIEKEEDIDYTEENGYTTVENKINPDEILTIENYKRTKTIIKNRLKELGVDQYRIVLDETTGSMQIRIPENKNTDLIINNLMLSGTFELRDTETQEVLMDSNSLKKSDIVYSQGQMETAVFIQFKFNKQGEQKLEEIRNTYIETTAETINEEGETEETTVAKTVDLYLNGQFVREINPQDSIMNKMLYLGLGQSSDSSTLEQYKKAGEEVIVILNSGILPISYTETDNIEKTTITTEHIKNGMYVAFGLIAVMIIIFIIGLKTKGIFASILQIGFIALLLLTLRYTNVKITIEGICGIVLVSIINYVYIYKAFKNIDMNFVKDVTVKFALKLIPVYVIAIILCFNKIANIYSLGMTIFWGSIVMYMYNLILTQITINTLKK